jgi:plastocyanin
MKKAVWIGLAVVAVLVVGTTLWLWGSVIQNAASNQAVSQFTVDRTDFTSTKEPTVAIRDLSFKPANIKVKKGTTVIWTNSDGVAHSIVADKDSPAGDLPTDSLTFGKADTFRVTFKQLGTFSYHCEPHTFMHGSVEVVE